MSTRNKISQKISGAVLIGAFLLVPGTGVPGTLGSGTLHPPVYALRATQPAVGAGAEELRQKLSVNSSVPVSAGLQEAAALEQWQRILADPDASGFKAIIEQRYGTNPAVYQDRLAAYRQLIQGAAQAGFLPDEQVVIIASTGRFRFFQGHTDFLGLGGRTLDAATEQEILFVLQETVDRRLHLSSSEPTAYPAIDFPLTGPDAGYSEHIQNPDLSELQYVARHFEEWGGVRAKARWPVDRWDYYVRGGLVLLMHQSPDMDKRFGNAGVRIHVSNLGDLALPAGMGVSSSAALNVGIGTGLNALFNLDLSRDQLAEIDLGERVLGKGKGAGDSAAIVFAQPKKVVAVGSYPVRYIGVAEFPEGLEVLQAVSPISRLTTSEGELLLRGRYSPEQASRVVSWARETMNRYSSAAYQAAVEQLLAGLKDSARYEPAGIRSEEAAAVIRALTRDDPNGLLRELTLDGALGRELPELAGWENRHRRYQLIYRLLLLIPESGELPNHLRAGLRKAALYGLAEEERGIVFMRELDAAVAAQRAGDGAGVRLRIGRVLDLVGWAHDGDRAVEDYRKTAVPNPSPGRTIQFPPMPWGADFRNDVSDEAIRRWITKLPQGPADDPSAWHSQELFSKPGGYERSIPDFDEIADEVRWRFNGRVRMRVSAAGLGGGMAVYIDATENTNLPKQVSEWLSSKGWQAKPIHLGTPVQVVRPPLSAGQEENPPSPITGHRLEETGIAGYRRVIYTLQNGASWQGGVVRSDVPDDAIAPTAYLAPYSFVEGAAARLEDGAQIADESTVSNSVVRSGAQLNGSVAENALIHPSSAVSYSALGPAFEDDSWSYSALTENNPALSVRNHSVDFGGASYRVEVGDRSSVRGAVFQDSVVGQDSEISGSALVISGWGEQTRMDGGVKSWLAVGAQGHADIAGVQHRPDGTEIPAALELAEMAYQGLSPNEYPGTQIRAHYVGYTEAVVTNSIPLVGYAAGELTVTPYPVPPITLFGDYTIFSIFAGSPNPASVKTDGKSTPGVVTRLTGSPGEQTSQHGRIIADPLSILPGFSNVIGRLLGFPELDNPLALLTEPEVTHLGALSAVGADAQLGLNGLEGWGQILPAEARGQLSRGSGIAPWVFLYSPEVLFSLMGQLASGLPVDNQSRYDDLPQRLLESARALTYWLLDQERAKGTQSNAQVIERLERYIAGYTALIDSGAWTGTWVQEGEELRHPEHWVFDNGRWESKSIDLEKMHQIIHPFASSVPYEQVSLKQLLEIPPGVDRPDWSEWTGYYLKPEDLKTDPPTPLDKLRSVPDQFKFWRIIGQDGRFYYTVEGGRIDKNIDLMNIHQSALIGPGTVLRGNRTRVGEGTRLLRVIADDSEIGKQTQLTAVRAERTIIGNGVKLTWAKLGGSTPATIGDGTVGSYVGVSEGSVVGKNNTFEPFALVVNSTTGPNNVIGISLVNSHVQPGFMGRHLSTAVHHLEQKPVRLQVNGKNYGLPAAALNVAGGLFIRGREDAPVELSVAYPLSLTTIDPGKGQKAEVGAFSVLKNQIRLDDGQILPLTFHAFNHIASTDPRFAVPGRHNDAIGGALEFPGIFLRNFIYRTKKGIYDSLRAEGFPPEQIAVHPRMLQSDYMVEATIVSTLNQVINQLREIDMSAYDHLTGTGDAAMGRLLRFVESDLSQIEQVNQSALSTRAPQLQVQINSAIGQVQQALASLPGSRPAGITTSSSGHTAAQLLEGVARLSQNLDGRWRMRNQTFTEVEWHYQAYDASRRARDTWVPVAKQDSAPIPLPAGALSEGKYLFIGPEAAVPALWAGLGQLQPSAGETIRLVVFGRNADHLKTIRAEIGDYSFASSAEFVDLSQYQFGFMGAVSAQIKVLGISGDEDSFEYRLIQTLNDLGVLGKFLQIPNISFRAWEQQIQQSGLEENV